MLSLKNLTRLLVASFLLWIPNGSLQSIFSQFSLDTFRWQPTQIGLMFSILGVLDILGYSLIAAAALSAFYPLFIAGMVIFGFGDAIFGPAFNGLLSKSADPGEQGRIQGGSQSIQALARMIGPLLGGQLYISLGHASPAIMGIILIAAAVGVLMRSVQGDR